MVLVSGFRVLEGLGFWFWGFRIWGFRVEGLGFTFVFWGETRRGLRIWKCRRLRSARRQGDLALCPPPGP